HVRVVRRENGIRIYGPSRLLEHTDPLEIRVDALVNLVAALYAPLPKASLQFALGRLRYAMPQDAAAVRAGVKRAKERLSTDGAWFWPEGEKLGGEVKDEVRFLAPFDPL